MNKFIAVTVFAVIPTLPLAQSQEDTDKGYLTTLIEDNLSGGSRSVNIVGFAGALSSEASIEQLTVSDAQGIWLTLEGVVLDWNRAALLRGRIDVSELSATRIVVARAPVADATAAVPSPEATPFSLPELPVGITLDALQIDEIILGESFLGEELRFDLTGSAALAGGEGNAKIIANRLGDKLGKFEIDGAYSNADRVLALILDVEEAPAGIAATLLELPDRPSVKLSIEGTGPLDNYGAAIALATGGQDRISGDFALQADDTGQVVRLNIGGDVTPLFAPEYQAFFGDDIQLDLSARKAAEGPFSLDQFALKAREIALSGSADIGPDGWPQRLNIQGRIAGEDDKIVLLPLSGPKTYISSADIDVTYDAAVSTDWTANIDVAGFDRPGLFIADLNLVGGGILVSGEGDAVGEVSANLTYIANGLELDDTGASEAFGDKISGVVIAARKEGEPTKISNLTVTGPGLEAQAEATIEGADPGLRIESDILLNVEALERFSTLAGRDLSGSGRLAISANATPLDGLFDVIVTGSTQDLEIGIPQLDAVFVGTGDISANAIRDGDGTRLEALRVKTDAAELTGTADITSGQSQANFDLALTELSLIEPRLSGPASLTGTARRDVNGIINADVTAADAGAKVQLKATVNPTETSQTITFDVVSDISNLGRYSAIAGRDLGGAATANVTGTVMNGGADIVADIVATTRDLRSGVAQLDPLLTGAGTVSATVSRTNTDQFVVKNLDVKTPQATIAGNASGGLTGAAVLDLTARVADVGVLGQGLRGPMTLALDATRDDSNNAKVTAAVNGPGTSVDVTLDIDPAYNIAGDVNANVDNLATYQRLIGQPVSGGISAQISGSLKPDLSQFDATIAAQSRNLGLGNATADLLLRGAGRLNADASLQNGNLRVDGFSFAAPNISLSGDLGGQSGAGRGTFQARLTDVGLLTDQLSGPVTADGTASLDAAGNWGIDAQATGPGGIAVQANGRYGGNGQVNLNASGSAPLGLANRILEPRRLSGDATFDVAINGTPSLEALTGRVDLRDARLAAPTLGQALSNITGGATFANGTASLDISADVQSGGRLQVSGPITLTGAQNANIAVILDRVVIKDPELYETSISGAITMRGPITGGAQIGGNLELGQTDIQVPSSGVGALGDLPTVYHIAPSSAVQNTIAKAGASAADAAAASAATTAGPVYPLDITISAPSRIFIRGRGLDAELGGTLRIGGTTKDVQPVGLFELARGRISILEQRFDLTEGSASLQGSFEPFIRLVATTQSRTGTTISIIVEGPASEPVVTFESVPDLPQDEVLSQLIFGRDLASISPLQAVQLAAAVGTLAGRGGGGLIDNFRQNIGLDDFDVTTDEEGNAAVRAGKYLSDNVYTDVTVSSDGSTEINLNLDITDQITAKGTAGASGETSIGIFFEKDY